ncbi:CHAT domain-containing protein [Streptomyces sp. NPDC059456]|uniref:CHAT domain-containing protein n=1 Tax=Streptomyces sp. NPDC059456 TaxID=3346838 RepID=UPI0036BF2D8E
MSDAGDPEHTVRPAALQAMEERLERVVLHRDLTPVVESGALRDAQRLAELLSGEHDLAVRHLLGWFHWFRHQAIPVPANPDAGHDRPDLRAAVGALTACFLAGDDDLPPPLLPLIAESAAAYACELLPASRESDDPVRLRALAELWQRIVVALPAAHPHRAVHLSALGNVLRITFGRGGHPADLDAAIDRFREALSAAPVGPGRAMYLFNLGDALRVRGRRAAAAADLDGAVTLLRQAARAAPDDGPYQGLVLTSLGGALLLRYERAGAAADLDGAACGYRDAAEAFPAGHPGRTEALSRLCNVLRIRSGRTGSAADLDEAIETGRRAVDAAPAGHRHRATLLSDLGGALLARFERLGAAADLDAAVDHHRQAAEAVPADDSGRAVFLVDLGDALSVRFERDGTAADREAAVGAWSAASAAQASPVAVRARAGLSAARLLAWSGAAQEAARAAEAAVRLLPLVAQHRPEPPDRPDAIAEATGAAGAAVAAATAAALALAAPGGTARERAERALGLLETGRAVQLGQVLGSGGDVTELREHHPELAHRFCTLRDRRDRSADPPLSAGEPREPGAPGSAADDTVPARPHRAPGAHARHRTARELAAVLAEIRAREGFASFALVPTADELRAEAAHGPIVVFNVSTHRSDALLLTTEGVTGLPLPGLGRTAVIDRVNAFRRARDTALAGDDPAGREEAQAVLVGVLEWLWDAAAGPVLEALGHRVATRAGGGGSTTDLPRLWWAPGGLLGLLPLHAAGHHTDAPDDPYRRTVMDRVVSSYTPTVRALRHARRRGRLRAGDPAAGRALIVAMPTTPGLPGDGMLPFADAEAALLAGRFAQSVVLRESGRADGPAGPAPAAAPTKANVLAQLPHCAIAHFACHGTSDPADPARSRLLLHDHAQDPLTVRSLAPVALDRARLAYLSACQTGAIGAADPLDGAVHLTSALQLAGFPHVVGTLWETGDRTAVRITRAFYDGLRTESAALDPDRAARALHAAVRQVRDGEDLPTGRDRRRAPLLWAAHVHAGA